MWIKWKPFFLLSFLSCIWKMQTWKRNLLFLFYLRQRSHSSSTIGLIKSIYVCSYTNSSSFLYLVDYGGSNLLPQLEVCDITTGESFKLPSRQHLYISFIHFLVLHVSSIICFSLNQPWKYRSKLYSFYSFYSFCSCWILRRIFLLPLA